jgi:hypothetical protein
MRVTQMPQPPTIKQIGPAAWLVSCQADSLSREAIEGVQDACLNALDRGALVIAVDLNGIETLPSGAVDVLAVVSEMLAARGGHLWLAWPHRGAVETYRVLSFDESSRRALDQMIEAHLIGAS